MLNQEVFSNSNAAVPFIVKETAAYIAVYKPPFMHCVPIKPDEKGTLLNWCCKSYPEIMSVVWKKSIEGGAIHRLDFETSGLVLFARTQAAMDFFVEMQAHGKIIKEYEAVSAGLGEKQAAFPPIPAAYSNSKIIKSAFRHYGRGRKAVRPAPITADSAVYQTEILNMEKDALGFTHFRLRITQGFRHQIRCHLAWIGYPLLNDILYGGCTGCGEEQKNFALNAVSLKFQEPPVFTGGQILNAF